MRRIIYFIALSTIFCVSSSCKSGSTLRSEKSNTDYLLTDFKPDEFYPAGQVELQISSKGSTVYGFAYTANGKGPHPTLLLLHGLPGNERGLDVAQNIRRAGYNVIYFNYRGTWGSKGRFSFENAIQDVSEVISYLNEPENSSALRVDTNKIFIAGHSMGAGIALLAGLENPKVKGIAAISVFNPYSLFSGDEARGNLISLKQYLLTLGMLNVNPDQFLDEILRKLPRYNIEEKVARSKKPVIIIDEHINNTYFAKYNKRAEFDYKIWDTDHAFTNRRIALTTEIKNWLDKNTQEPVISQAK